MSTTTISPCPFCEQTEPLIHERHPRQWEVKCRTFCCGEVTGDHETKEEAIAEWEEIAAKEGGGK
jgi:hypothetical protein